MITQEQAETLALTALTWLAEQDLLDAFQSTTGADLSHIKTAAAEPELLAAVLDFLLMRDDWVAGFCDMHTLPYESLMSARAALPGGDLPHWT